MSATAASVILLRVGVARGSLVVVTVSLAVAALALAGFAYGLLGHGERRSRFDAGESASGLSLIARLNVAAAIGLCVAGVLLVAAKYGLG